MAEDKNMNLSDALSETRAAILRAEAEGFENTAVALRELAIEIEKYRLSGTRPYAEKRDRLMERNY